MENKLKKISNKKKSDSEEDSTISIGEMDMETSSDGDDTPATYINPELDNKTDKIQFSSPKDLVSHRYDYDYDTFKEIIYMKRKKKVIKIKKIPQYEQKSQEWLDQRNKCLTATAIAVALDEDPYKFPAELLLDKCGKGPPFEENENVHHGKKYEQIGTMFYSFRNNVSMGEYGLLQHEQYPFIGASPDGICNKTTLDGTKLTKLVGRLLEIKFPKTRKIITDGKLDGDIVPHYYMLQILTQLYVTGLDECDFLQCKIEEYESWEDFVKDSHPNIPGLSKKTNLEKGCLIQLLPKKMAGGDPKMCLYHGKYIYPPNLHMDNDETKKWIANEVMHFHTNELSKDYLIDRIIYWRLEQVACHLVKANNEWFESKIPILQQFWRYVLFYRKNPKKLDRLVKFINEIGIKKSDIIFEKIHRDYVTVHKNTKYKPLYQKETEWRKKYNEKYASYQKYLEFRGKNRPSRVSLSHFGQK